jgi:hypothetical protein
VNSEATTNRRTACWNTERVERALEFLICWLCHLLCRVIFGEYVEFVPFFSSIEREVDCSNMLSVWDGLFLPSQEEHGNNKYTESKIMENLRVKPRHAEWLMSHTDSRQIAFMSLMWRCSGGDWLRCVLFWVLRRFLCPSRQTPDQDLDYVTTPSFQIHPNLSAINHPLNRRCIIHLLDSAVK